MELRKVRRVPLYLGAAILVVFANPYPAGTVIGILLIAIGEGIRIWAAGHLQKNEVLTVSGPYAYVKNPLYIGSVLISAGYCIFADNVYLLAAIMFAFCFHYIPYKKKVEGDRLRRIFGQRFDDWDEKVPEYIPRWTPYSHEKVRWSFHCIVQNSEEGIFLLNLLGVALILTRPYWGCIL
jgi:protein-S-isoprenylcysteine O-methyltransferase Ste14